MYEPRDNSQESNTVVLNGRDIADATRLLALLIGRNGPPVGAALPDGSSRLETDEKDGKSETDDFLNLARQLFHERRVRQRFFNRAMFSEPGWDMLLSLYIAHTGGPPQTITRITRAVCAPMTTALRWINYLEKEDFIARSGHPTDNRQVLITLTEVGRSAMDDFLSVILRDRVSFSR